jgi:hypothetical protein
MVRKLDTPTTYNQQSYIDPPNFQYAYDYNSVNIGSTSKPCQGRAIALAPIGDPLVAQLSTTISAASQTVLNFTTESDL